jgi:hypothetical protein
MASADGERVGATSEDVEDGYPYWLSGPCPVWCNNLHDHQYFVEDRRHVSTWSKRLRLSAMDAVRVDNRGSGGDMGYLPCAIQVWVEQGYREAQPEVHLEEDHRRGVFIFTLAEAERVAKALTKAVTLAKSDARRR